MLSESGTALAQLFYIPFQQHTFCCWWTVVKYCSCQQCISANERVAFNPLVHLAITTKYSTSGIMHMGVNTLWPHKLCAAFSVRAYSMLHNVFSLSLSFPFFLRTFGCSSLSEALSKYGDVEHDHWFMYVWVVRNRIQRQKPSGLSGPVHICARARAHCTWLWPDWLLCAGVH